LTGRVNILKGFHFLFKPAGGLTLAGMHGQLALKWFLPNMSLEGMLLLFLKAIFHLCPIEQI
jgi:hypothetical protein